MKYQRFTASDCEDKGICKFEFVAKTQNLCGEFKGKKITIEPRTMTISTPGWKWI